MLTELEKNVELNQALTLAYRVAITARLTVAALYAPHVKVTMGH